MSYLLPEDKNILNDLSSRKVFLLFEKQNYSKDKNAAIQNDNFQFISYDYLRQVHQLELTNYQMFCTNFFNPNTPYKTLLLNPTVGSGNPITALSIAMEFIKML